MQVWAVANQKGGVGKTTTVVALGGLLAERGKRVLMLDLDPQASLTAYCRCNNEGSVSAFELFSNDAPSVAALRRLVQPTSTPNLSLIAGSTVLATAERQLAGQEGMGLRVSRALSLLAPEIDVVLIDTPPVLGVLMVNALAACDRLIVPVQTEFLALKGLERMQNTLQMVSRSLRREFAPLIVPTMFDRRTQASVSSLRLLRQSHGAAVWPSVIPVDTRFRDASREGVPPSLYDPGGRGVRAYTHLLDTLLGEPLPVEAEVEILALKTGVAR